MSESGKTITRVDSPSRDEAIETIKNARWMRSDKSLPANADFFSVVDSDGKVEKALQEGLGYTPLGLCGDGTNSFRVSQSGYAMNGNASSTNYVSISPQTKVFLDAECQCDIAAQPAGEVQGMHHTKADYPGKVSQK